LRELEAMAEGRMSHHWDLFTPLIIYVANEWLPKHHKLQPKDINPFAAKKEKRNMPQISVREFLNLKAVPREPVKSEE
jgi:hypothetical protein